MTDKETIPTAEEHCVELGPMYGINSYVIDSHIEFAKLHVRAALKAAAENAKTKWSGDQESNILIDKDSILNAYPDTNIK